MSEINWVSLVRSGDVAGFDAARAELEDGEGAPSLEASSFKELHIAGFDFAGCDLSNTEWDNCRVEKVSFSHANLEGAYFDHCTMTDCKFGGSNLEGSSFDASSFLRCELSTSNVSASELEGCDFTDCKLEQLALDEVDWKEISMTRVALSQISGSDGELTNVILREAQLFEVDTSGLTCKRCRATTTNDAKLPAGFSPLSGKRRRV